MTSAEVVRWSETGLVSSATTVARLPDVHSLFRMALDSPAKSLF